MESWLSATIQRDLGPAIDPASGQQPNNSKGTVEDDGSNLRWENQKGPFVITVSDSVTYLKATISSAAAAEHQKKTGARITEGTLGNIIQLSDAEIVATHLGPRPSRVTILVSRFKIVGSDKSGQFGIPRPFEATDIGRQLLAKLTFLRESKESHSRAQGVAKQDDGDDPSKLRTEHREFPGDGRLASQQLLSQVPSRLAGLHLPRNSGETREHENVVMPKNQSEALLKMLRAKGSGGFMSSNEVQRQDRKSKAASSPKMNAATGKPDIPLFSEASPISLSQKGCSASASVIGSPTSPKAQAPPSNSKSKRIRSRDVRISNEQQMLLDHEDSWLPAEPGHRGPVANLPIAVLQEITQHVEQLDAERAAPPLQPVSENSPHEAQEVESDSETDGRAATDTGSLVPSADWPPSSPVPALRELPPDSSLPMQDVAENEIGFHSQTQPTGDASADEYANEDNVASVSRRDSMASLLYSPILPSQKPLSPAAQPGHETPIKEHVSPSSTGEIVACLSTTQSNLVDTTLATACNEVISIDSDSELETTVPLKLSGECAHSPKFESTQEVPATAYDSQEPVLQVKRTPYGRSEAHGHSDLISYSSSASGLYPSPSKERRIDEPETPPGLRSRDLNQTAEDSGPAARSDSRSTSLARDLDPNHTSGIEETCIAYTGEPEAVQGSSSVTSPRRVTAPSVALQSQRSEQPDLAPQPLSSPTDGRHDLKRKALPPILSAYVSKRRKVNRSPFAFKFSQDEYPKEDPSIAARRHREEFFASRRNSHATSHTTSPEIGQQKLLNLIDNGSHYSSPSQKTSRLRDDRQNMQEPLRGSRGESVATRSGQRSPFASNGRNPIEHEGPASYADDVHRPSHINSVTLTSSRSIPTAIPDAEHQTASQSPLTTSIEQPDLLLAQSLHSVSTKLEAISSTDISQQTNISGQAQSLPELMTPALSIADLPQQSSSAQKNATVHQEITPQSDIFARFKSQYPDYLGTREHFVGMCRRILQLLEADRMEHKSLWDDFIIRHKTDYPQYCQRCMETAEDAKPYERFYREEIDEPKYSKRIMQPPTLSAVIPDGTCAVAVQRSVSPVKLESPNARFGAQSKLSSVAPGRSSPLKKTPRPNRSDGRVSILADDRRTTEAEGDRRSPEIKTKRPAGFIKAGGHSDALTPKVTIDLTGERSPSPTPAIGQRSLNPSPKKSTRPSPRKMPWREGRPSTRSPSSGEEKLSQARNGGSFKQSSKQRTLSGSLTAPSSRTADVVSTRDGNSTKKSMVDTVTSDRGVVKPLSSTQAGSFKRSESKLDDSSSTNIGREQTVPDPGNRSQSKQQTTHVDEWWKDDNTPFREYARLYQSITPGRGNAWASEKAREKNNGKRAETGPLTSASDVPSSTLNNIYLPPSSPRATNEDDARFSVRFSYGETELSVTPIFMNAVELSARYAEMDFHSRVQQRHGTVLAAYPQVEIAVIPVPPATSVQVRLVIWAIYALVLDMVNTRRWFESEMEVRWEDQVKAHIFFTKQMDDSSSSSNGTQDPVSMSTSEMSNMTSNSAVNAQFNWVPLYKPNGHTLQAKDVFVLALGAIKTIAQYPTTQQITGPFHIGSELVDAHLEVWPQGRRNPRPVPPFMRWGYALEAVRRIPGWELDRRRFAEFFCSVEVMGRPAGVIVMDKGPIS
ncbi:MAG: hypothetical protein Q9208_007554 [Pyrenodesmia sp. 3 TL-2023]